MSKLKIYLDNCCFGRPFDNQDQLKIYLETQAKLAIQEKILIGEYALIWSYILDYENAQHPIIEARHEVERWYQYAAIEVQASEIIIKQAQDIMQRGIQQKDALHVACALFANADYFITTDRKLLNKLLAIDTLHSTNPITFVEEHNL